MTKEVFDKWYASVEQSKQKANALLKKVVAVFQSTSIAVGKLEDVDIDRLWKLKYPYCKLSMANPVRFRLNGRFDCKLGEQELFFVNKPEMIISMEELSDRHPEIYKEVHTIMRKERLW